MHYVIIGNSTAGIGAVEGIRQVDQQGEITIISREPYHTYSRPLISYLLLGKTTLAKMQYRDEGFYAEKGCRLLCGKTVVQVRPDLKQVVTEDGQGIFYDKLLVATGSEPVVPPIPGLETVDAKFTFTSLDDAQRLSAALSQEKRVLIVGAGLIGLKCAEGLVAKVRKVTVVDLAARILSSILDEEGAGLVQKHLENHGINFRLATGVKGLTNGCAFLDNGETVEFDLLVLAVGVRPNVALLEGIAWIEKGIVVDEKGATTAKDIYAAGDCTQTLDVSSGEQRVLALLPNAYMQGECAGINMAGGEKRFAKAIPMNAIGFLGQHIITAGNYFGQDYLEKNNTSYKRLFYSDNKLNGYILIGNVEKAGIYTNLIREGTPLDSLDFAMICERPGLMAFSKEVRGQKLGGRV